MLGEHLVLTALPATFAACFAITRGLRDRVLLLALALAASGMTATLAFWAYYADPVVGQTFACLLVLGSLQGTFLCWRRGLDQAVLRQLAVPAALWALSSGFVLFFGFIHGGVGEPLHTAAIRYLPGMPTDNGIPRYFAEWFYAHGHQGPPPLFGDWLSSDRPPLQVGYALAQRPFGWSGQELHYQVAALVIQQLWVVAMWAVLCAARLRPRTRGLAILAALVSDVAIFHGFFVWPKLIAAAFMLAALSLLLHPDWQRLSRDGRVAALFAALCGFALLAHGSSVFFVIPLLLLVAWRGVPSWRWLGVAALVGLAVLAPWSAYQSFADPPGNRLVKWQLGGAVKVDDRGSLEAIADGYREAGFGGTLDNKWRNVKEVIGTKWPGRTVREVREGAEAEGVDRAAAALRIPRFFSILPFLGLLLIAPLAMAVARIRGRPSGREWRFSLFGFALSGGVCLLWVLLMFGPPAAVTVIHQGPLAVPLLLTCACVAGAFALSPGFGAALVAANTLLVLALYAPAVYSSPDSSYSLFAALLATACLAGFGFIALRERCDGR